MKLSLTPRRWLSLGLLLGSLGWASGCAVGVPTRELPGGGNGRVDGTGPVQRQASGGESAQRSPMSKYPARRAPEPQANAAQNRGGAATSQRSFGDESAALDALPGGEAASNRSATSPNPTAKASQPLRQDRELASTRSTADVPLGRPNPTTGPATPRQSSGTNLSLSDSPVPNPLRDNSGDKPQTAAAGSANQLAGKAERPSAVQTVGYQEEIPIFTGERIPQNPDNVTRLAMLEEPEMAAPAPASVLEAEGFEPSAEPASPESVPAEAVDGEQQLPWDDDGQQQGSPAPPAPGSFAPERLPNGATPAATAQGHYQQGMAVYGQVLNEPQQTASQRAIQLLDENQQLREEMKGKLKELENAYAKLKQQDELWARARQEFVEVRGVVDNLTRENSLLKVQIEKLEGEKVELTRQYQGLMQTVEQTLDDLLLKAITETPQGNPPAAAPATAPARPPFGAPATQPPPAPPVVNGQQASALLKSK